MGRTLSTLVAAALVAVLLCDIPRAAADDVPCNNITTDVSCGFDVRQLSLQKVPALFQFQARIAQAKLPLGDATFKAVVVKLLRGVDVLCQEQVDNVQVQGGVLNLTIGQNMSCELGEVIAENANLSFQVCLGGSGGCLKPIELATTPYALKATYASVAQQSEQANIAGRANYAHRATADRELYLRKKLGVGYFDFYTHAWSDAAALYSESEYQSRLGDGFIQWCPVNPEAGRLHIVGKSQATGQLALLDELVLASKTTLARGDLTVTPGAGGAGLTVASGGGHVTGDSEITGALLVSGVTSADGGLTVTGDADILGTLDVVGPTTVLAGGVQVVGTSKFGGDLLLVGGLQSGAGLQTTGNVFVDALLTAGQAAFDSGLSVQGAATLASLGTGSADIDGQLGAGSAQIAGDVTVGGDLHVTGSLAVKGETVFNGSVTFEAGYTEPEGAADARYVRAVGETRDLTFGGHVEFLQSLTFLGGLDMAKNQLLNMRLQVSAGPPVPCAAPTEGFFYLDSLEKKAMLCNGGKFKPLGGDVCGNGNVQPTEGCDDGNTVAGDGCSSACTVEKGWGCSPKTVQPTTCSVVCSDGWVGGPETCDDKNLVDGDGCSSTCKLEVGWECTGEPSVCEVFCGDGLVKGAEACDDGNTADGDGCSSACVVESGWGCSLPAVQPSTCSAVCSDGLILGAETCDDSNLANGDGCSSTCKLEAGWECTGEPSGCLPVCGDGFVKGSETCDDGGVADGDGCDAVCAIEQDWSCTGEPSACVASVCGDGKISESETCDDGNLKVGDGCDADCVVEPAWKCSSVPSACVFQPSSFDPPCTVSWFQGVAYAFCPHPGGLAKAIQSCEVATNGTWKLASANSSAENSFLTGLVVGANSVWIGLQIQPNGQWGWKLPGNGNYGPLGPYTNWAVPHPVSGYDCGLLSVPSGGQWHSVQCGSNSMQGYLCSRLPDAGP